MAVFALPSNAVLQQAAQAKLPNLMQNRAIFDIFPIKNIDSSILVWDQKDNYVGLQQIRGYNGQPANVTPTGGKQYIEKPGVYGEYALIDELTLTERRQYGSFNQPIDLSDLVAEKQDQLLGRRLDRIEQIGWTLLATGTAVVAAPNGATLYSGAYTFQTYTAGVTWATFATATPLADLSAVQLLSRGYSVNFGAVAKAYMNRVTFNNMRSNTNNADIYGRRVAGLSTANSLALMNQVFQADDLPEIVINDQGYLAQNGSFTPFIPNNKVVVVGQRPAGDVIGNYLMTRNASNPGMAPGPFMGVTDNSDDQPMPRTITVWDGHNGGCAVYFPSAIAIMTV